MKLFILLSLMSLGVYANTCPQLQGQYVRCAKPSEHLTITQSGEAEQLVYTLIRQEGDGPAEAMTINTSGQVFPFFKNDELDLTAISECTERQEIETEFLVLEDGKAYHMARLMSRHFNNDKLISVEYFTDGRATKVIIYGKSTDCQASKSDWIEVDIIEEVADAGDA